MVQLVQWDHQVVGVLKVKMELQDSPVNLDLLDQLEILVQLALQEPQVAQVGLEHQVLQD